MSDKALSIKEVSELYKITTNKLRFYEKKGLLSPSRHPENGYRQYFIKDLLTIQAILTYRALELSIEDIRDLLLHASKEELVDRIFNQWELVKILSISTDAFRRHWKV